ncbi:MAG TPA: hypothetical protein PLB12_08045 [Candidatus Goldiibacteriota bacterium]|nr:hypothetical protein [Candidatus Goldiibacteriota bacterium]HPI02367.1 hypothetical protein [Candidatus Goldiibacteriota bacterium]HRQ44286.1 hypothetical protein [Candidatus Goldiibacteriota bacterium]
MKKNIFLAFFIFAAACVNGADLRNFTVLLQAGTFTAGDAIPVTITAYDVDNAVKADYTGNVTATASVGDIIFVESDAAASTAFTAGKWMGKIKAFGADPSLAITFTDSSGATGTAAKQMNPGAYATRIILTKGQEYAPGTALGYTGLPETMITKEEFYVTVTACDQYYNRISGSYPSNVRLYTGANYSGVTPSAVNMALTDVPGTAVYSVTLLPYPDNSDTYTINSEDFSLSPPVISVDRYFVSKNTYFIWPEINNITYTAGEISVFAGSFLTVTVKASNYPREAGKGIFYDFNKNVSIKAVEYDNHTAFLEPLVPDTVPVTSGEGSVVVNYTKMDRIKIMPDCTDYDNGTGTYYYVTKLPSDIVQVYADAPQSFSFVSDKTQIRPGETANLSVTVFDAYMNPVSKTAVAFDILPAGAGTLSVTNATTDNYDYVLNYQGGLAQSVYTAPLLGPLNVTITATVAGLAPKTIVMEYISATSTADKKTVKNTPNPFNPDKGVTKIGYYLEADSKVTFKLYNMFGGLVWDKEFSKSEEQGLKGPHELVYDGKTNSGFKIGVGLYVLKITVENDSEKYVLERKIAVKK